MNERVPITNESRTLMERLEKKFKDFLRPIFYKLFKVDQTPKASNSDKEVDSINEQTHEEKEAQSFDVLKDIVLRFMSDIGYYEEETIEKIGELLKRIQSSMMFGGIPSYADICSIVKALSDLLSNAIVRANKNSSCKNDLSAQLIKIKLTVKEFRSIMQAYKYPDFQRAEIEKRLQSIEYWCSRYT